MSTVYVCLFTSLKILNQQARGISLALVSHCCHLEARGRTVPSVPHSHSQLKNKQF